MTDQEQFTATVTTSSDERYTAVQLRDKHKLVSDEPEWLPDSSAGDDNHPAPVDFLLMSLTACQVSVLQQCLERNDVDAYRIECEAVLDEYGTAEEHPEEMPKHTALRIDHITVTMTLVTTDAYKGQANRCLSVYDDGCIVGQSLRGGIDYTPLTILSVADSEAEIREA